MMTDPISDLLTRIRNGIHAGKEVVEIPYSKYRAEILKILVKEGYVKSFNAEADTVKGKILVALKYTPKNGSMITHLSRISKPGRRVYVSYKDLKPVLGGIGISIISTSQGLMSDKQAKEAKLGGEVLCNVW